MPYPLRRGGPFCMSRARPVTNREKRTVKLKKTLAAVGTAALLTGGLLAAPAFAEDEVCTPSEAWTETIEHPAIPAVGKPVIKNPDYVPASTVEHPAVPAVGEPTIPNPEYTPEWVETVVVTPGSPEVPAVTHTEWEFKHFVTGKTKWKSDPNWNAEWNWESIGWFKTGATKEVVDVPAVPAVEEVTKQVTHPAVGEPTIPNPEYVAEIPAWTEEIPEQGKKFIKNPDFVPAVDAWTETVEHEAVECPVTEEPTEEPSEEPTTEEPVETPVVVVPAPQPTVNVTVTPTEVEKTTAVKDTKKADTGERTELAETGSVLGTAAAISLGLLLLGGTFALIARRRTN